MSPPASWAARGATPARVVTGEQRGQIGRGRPLGPRPRCVAFLLHSEQCVTTCPSHLSQVNASLAKRRNALCFLALLSSGWFRFFPVVDLVGFSEWEIWKWDVHRSDTPPGGPVPWGAAGKAEAAAGVHGARPVAQEGRRDDVSPAGDRGALLGGVGPGPPAWVTSRSANPGHYSVCWAMVAYFFVYENCFFII